MKVNLPFERIPEHANDPGFGPVPPRSNVLYLHDEPCCCEFDTCTKECKPRRDWEASKVSP